MATIYGRKHTIRRGYLLVPQQMTGPGGKVYDVDLEYQVFDGETGAPISDTRTVGGEQHGNRLVVGDPHRDTQLFEYTIASRPTSESEGRWHGYQAALGDRQWHLEGQSKKYYAQTRDWWDGYNQGHRDKRDPSAGYVPNGNVPDAVESERLDDLTAYCSTLLNQLHGDALDGALEGTIKRRGLRDTEFRQRALDNVHPDDLVRALAENGITLARFGIAEVRTGHVPNSTMNFEQAKQRRDDITSELDRWTAVLNSFPRGSMGLVSDSARALPEYREARANTDRLFRELQNFNVWFVKEFKSELAKERRIKRSGGLKPNHAAVHYVWLIDYRGVPMDTEGPYGPMSIDRASSYARIGAKEGDHDRVVSVGREIMSDGFEIVRRYRRGTGERIL